MDGERVVQVIKESLDDIDASYYAYTPTRDYLYANYGVEPGNRDYKALKKYLTHRDERVFCYELYHKVRCRMDAENDAADERGLVFQGELCKHDIGALGGRFNPSPADRLGGTFVPDFILHQRRTFGHQELVVEVKAHPNLTTLQVKKDLEKLNRFVAKYNFKRAVFLAVNCTHTVVQDRLTALERSGWIARELSHRQSIQVLTKDKQIAPTYECKLDNPTLTCVEPQPRAAAVPIAACPCNAREDSPAA